MTTSSIPNSLSNDEKIFNFVSDIFHDFVDYIDSFYGTNDPLYPLVREWDRSPLDRNTIYKAIHFYLCKIIVSNGELTWGDGDSVDRERVRDILIAHYGYVFAGGAK